MRTKSPQRTRRIRNSAIVGGVVGLAIAYICLVLTHNPFFLIFVLFGAGIAGATAALASTEQD